MNPAQTTTARKLTKARVQLILSQAFFGTLCLRLKLIPGNLPTMATDGVRIIYNPAFVDQLTPAELEGTLAHESLALRAGPPLPPRRTRPADSGMKPPIWPLTPS